MISFPTFIVIERRTDELVGSVSSTKVGGETWVADRYPGFLKHGDSLFPGRWHSAGENWKFALDKAQTNESLPASDEFQILDSYWGERVELVLNRRIVWRDNQWTVPDDHDHRAICWATIAVGENQNHFVATTSERVCRSCYEAYVSTRALTFIAVADNTRLERTRR